MKNKDRLKNNNEIASLNGDSFNFFVVSIMYGNANIEKRKSISKKIDKIYIKEKKFINIFSEDVDKYMRKLGKKDLSLYEKEVLMNLICNSNIIFIESSSTYEEFKMIKRIHSELENYEKKRISEKNELAKKK